MHTADSVLETLFLPFQSGALQWPDDGILFLRARDGAPLRNHAARKIICAQSFKPDADALLRAGFVLDNSDQERRYSIVLVLPPRQRDEARALWAHAISLTKPGGRIIGCAANDAGAKSHESDLEKIAGSIVDLSKNKCRVFWSGPLGELTSTSVLEEWRALDAPRLICDGRYTSRPGVFAWDRIDAASALLAKHLPAGLAGTAADLGAGFGYLSIELLCRCRGIDAIHLFEAEQRALDLARINLTKLADAKQEFHWHDVTTGLPRRYDVIVTNPPFHAQGSADRPDIGRRFIAVAAQSLNPGGCLWLVANRHLPYEAILDSNFGKTRIVAQEHGFKIIEAVKSSARR
jgi:16S rRNA (guanine1207-N2)-methyltransferase